MRRDASVDMFAHSTLGTRTAECRSPMPSTKANQSTCQAVNNPAILLFIVVQDGCALSDRELTDNEGPPSHVPIWRPPIIESDEEEAIETPCISKDSQTPENAGGESPIYEVIQPARPQPLCQTMSQEHRVRT